MALSWPDTAAVKRLLDVTSEEFDEDLDSLLGAAVSRVKLDCGLTVDGDADPDAEPETEGQVEAAKRAVVLLRPGGNDALAAIAKDAQYNALIMGKRKRRGFA